MAERQISAGWLAAALVVSLLAPSLPLHASSVNPGRPTDGKTAGLNGVIRSADMTPLAGVRLLVADRENGGVARSARTTADGNFTIDGLEPGRYDLAVETDLGLYVVRAPIELVPGVNRTVQVAVGGTEPADTDGPTPAIDAPLASAWDNPAAAGGIVLGLAVLIGILVKNATEDEISASTVQIGN